MNITMRLLKAVLFLALFFIAANSCLAFSFESQTIKYSIVDNRVVVQSVMKFETPQSGVIYLPIEGDASVVELYVDGEKVEPQIQGSYIAASLYSASKIGISYITEELIDKSNFLLNFPVDYDTNSLNIMLVLPEEAVLKEPITDRDGSVYPTPDAASTDGRSLIFVWERENLKEGDAVSIFAMYKEKMNYKPIVAVLVIVIIALAAYAFFGKTRVKKSAKKPQKKPKTEKAKKPKTEPKILEHLKEDEKQIVRVLKQRNGQCEQGTLRIVTNFSKAHLSRLLSELEARNIVFKEKRGKKNLVFLK